MNFSLIQVTSRKDNQVKGVWVQNHLGGTIESATAAAIRTEEVNGSKLDIAVIPIDNGLSLCSTVRCMGAERLDQQRITPAPNPHGYGRWSDDWADH
jgi:hypothetical protein